MRSMLFILIHCLLLAVLAVTLVRMRQARRRQDELLAELRDTPNWTRIFVSRPDYFGRLFKLLPYEARGVLINEGETVRVLAELSRGERIDHRYPKGSINLRWLGNARLADGNLHWIAIGPASDALMISADTGLNAASSRQASADIVRRIAPEFDLPRSARKDFALEKNRRSLFVLIAVAVLIGFAMIDGIVLNHNVLLKGKTLITMAPLLGLLAIACYPVLTRGGVPARESGVLCMLLGMAICCAFVPLVKRADQWAAGNATLTVVYELQEKSRFIAVNSAAPEIDYAEYHEYWEQFEPGSSHQFQLIHGPFGLWQLKETLIRERLRAFYKKDQ